MQTYFGHFGHAWLRFPKMTVFNVYLHAKNKFHNSLLSCNITFQRILQFDRPAAFWPTTRDPKLCQICSWNINNNISFHYRLFSRKTNIKLKLSKNSKSPILGLFCALWPKLGPKINFPGKKRLCQVFNIRIIYQCAKSQNNLMSHSWENCWRDTPKTSLFH